MLNNVKPKGFSFIEATPPQLQTGIYQVQGELYKFLPASYAVYRLMRKDPTIALGRALSVAPILASSWSVESDDDTPQTIIDYLTEYMLPLRSKIMRQASYGLLDFGNCTFEIVPQFNERSKYIDIFKIKHLLPDLSIIQIDESNGAFLGIKQVHPTTGYTLFLDKSKLLHLWQNEEGTNWYGESTLENIRAAWLQGLAVETVASQYDAKCAGVLLGVYYLPGQTSVAGTMTDNFEIAEQIASDITASGSVVIPLNPPRHANEKGSDLVQWKVEYIGSGSGGLQPQFIERLRYLDVLKIRGLLLPERAVLEGNFGTKAEAGEHIDFAIAQREQTAQDITDKVNDQIVNRLIELNFGAEQVGKVRLAQSPLADKAKSFISQLYMNAINQNPAELQNIDLDAIKDRLDIPKAEFVTPINNQVTDNSEPQNV